MHNTFECNGLYSHRSPCSSVTVIVWRTHLEHGIQLALAYFPVVFLLRLKEHCTTLSSIRCCRQMSTNTHAEILTRLFLTTNDRFHPVTGQHALRTNLALLSLPAWTKRKETFFTASRSRAIRVHFQFWKNLAVRIVCFGLESEVASPVRPTFSEVMKPK